MIGSRLGAYEVLAKLGEGGMGEVYRARDTRLDREVALKTLLPGRGLDDDARRRFAQEARAASSLNHPNIVTVFDVGSDRGIEFIAMELVPGQSLDQRIPRAGMNVRDLLAVAIPIAGALAKAHTAGLVHRDLKPGNVMVTPDGVVKVLDFGLAKATGPADPTVAASMATQTARGVVLGTSAYMSPEQAEAKNVDARSDIFSFGVTLYEMAAGKRPFAGDSQAAVIASVLRETPGPLADVRPDLPAELVRLVHRCLQKDPERRAQSMADLRVALTEIKEDIDAGRVAAPSSPRADSTRRSSLWIAAGAAALMVVALVVWRLPRAGSSPPDAPLEVVPLTTYPGDEFMPTWSPDGNQFAFVWSGENQNNLDVYVQAVGTSAPLRLTTDAREDVGPKWSPDGRYIAFMRRLEPETYGVFLVSPLGGPERRLGQVYSRIIFNQTVAGVCWSADSRSLLVSGAAEKGQRHSIYRIAIDTNEMKPLVIAGADSDGYERPAMSPDGRTLASVQITGGGWIFLHPLSAALEAGAGHRLETARTFTNFAWTADGSALIATPSGNSQGPLYRVPIAGGAPEPMTWSGAGATTVAIAPAKHRLAFSRLVRDTNIWQATLDRPDHALPELRKLAASTFREVAPNYSPDGKRLAFHSNRGGTVQFWTSNADGSQAVPLTSFDATATTGTPRWSPDGQWIAFDSNAGGNSHLYVVAADGGRPRTLTSGNSQNFVTSWSRDGRWSYFGSARSGDRQVWRILAAGGEPEQVTREGGEAPTVSPDGEWLYFTRGDGAGGLFRMPIGGGAETRIADAIFRYNYAVGAAGAYWVQPRTADGTAAVRFRDAKTGQTTEILTISKPVDLGLALSPDGRSLLFTQVDYSGQDLMLVENFR